MWTSHYSGGVRLADIDRADYYDFDFQSIANTAVVIKRGDRLNTHCTFTTAGTDRTEPTDFFLGSEDEMCMHFLTYYPRLYDSLGSEWMYCGYATNRGPIGNKDGTACGSVLGVIWNDTSLGPSLYDINGLTDPDPVADRTRVFGQEGTGHCDAGLTAGQIAALCLIVVGGTAIVACVAYWAYRRVSARKGKAEYTALSPSGHT